MNTLDIQTLIELNKLLLEIEEDLSLLYLMYAENPSLELKAKFETEHIKSCVLNNLRSNLINKYK